MRQFLEYAKENGLLVDDREFQEKHKAYRDSAVDKATKNFLEGSPSPKTLKGGAESDVYLDEKSQRVFKRNNLTIHGSGMKGVVSYLNRLVIHNYLFPTTAYKLEGFTVRESIDLSVYDSIEERVKQKRLFEENVTLNVVVSQPFISGRESTYDEIRDHLKKMGLTPSGPYSNYARIGDDVNISDLRSGNAITDDDGNVHIIDPIIEKEVLRREVLERKIDRLEDPHEILDAILELYSLRNYVPTRDMEAIKRSVEEELGGARVTNEDIELLRKLNEKMNCF